MKILFWVPYSTEGPSNRYRVEQYLPFLKQYQIDYSLHSFWNKAAYRLLFKKGDYLKKSFWFTVGFLWRTRDIIQLGRYDCVFIHREASPFRFNIFERLVRILGKPIIFDFDDSIFLSNVSDANRFLKFLKDPRKVSRIISQSNLIIAGNRYLRDYALPYNKNTVIIPTVIDTDKYIPLQAKARKTEKVVIGWIGSETTTKYLGLVKDLLGQLINKFSHLEIHIIGGRLEGLLSPAVIHKRWNLRSELSDLQELDIGIMPISDDAWSRGKCAFKIIQYMAVGIPAVASAVGMNKEIIREGENGLLARNSQEWVERLSRLITDSQLRIALGKAGRETVEKSYSLQSQLNSFIASLKRFDHKE